MKSTKGSKTLTIAELYLQIRAMDLAGLTLDTAVASEFDVVAEYTYRPGLPNRCAVPIDDSEEGFDEELSIKAIKASANILFAGDASDVTIKRGTDIKDLFTGAQVAALEDRIYKAIQEGGSDD